MGPPNCNENGNLVIKDKDADATRLKLASQIQRKNCFRPGSIATNGLITSWLGHLSSEQEVRDHGNFLLPR